MKFLRNVLLLAPKIFYGGQAVMGGVMMKGKTFYSIAVNTPSGIESKTEEFHSISEKIPILKWPFIRGVVNLVEMMILGYRSLNYSADMALEEDEEESSGLGTGAMILTFLFSMVLAIALFKFLPLLGAKGLDSLFNFTTPMFNLVDGLIKLFILVMYMLIMSFIPDIREVFRYHGAEHKTINCYEAKKPLTIKNISSFTTLNRRCGTTFIFVVIFFSVLVYLFIPKDIPFVVNLGLRIALLPFIAAISYEVQRFSARYSFFLVRWIMVPGLLLQKITTKQPTPKHIRTGKMSLENVLKAEKSASTKKAKSA